MSEQSKPWRVLRADWDEEGNARYTLNVMTIGAPDARLIEAAPDLFGLAQALAAIQEGLDNGSSTAEDMAAQLAKLAREIVGSVEMRAGEGGG